MKTIISATNRKDARSLEVSKIVQNIYKGLGESVDILDLKQVPFEGIVSNPYEPADSKIEPYLDQVARSEALIIVCPEYNGGMPGLIKHFIDHWKYPDSFVYKPICFVGVGGKFGALKPVTHLQDIFIYRHSFVFPIRVCIQNIEQTLKDGKIVDPNIQKLLKKQATNFLKFVDGLKSISFD